MNESHFVNALLSQSQVWAIYFTCVWGFAYVTGQAAKLLKSNKFRHQVVGHIGMGLCYNVYFFLIAFVIAFRSDDNFIQSASMATLTIMGVTHYLMIKTRLNKEVPKELPEGEVHAAQAS
jgi:hypothetical protein